MNILVYLLLFVGVHGTDLELSPQMDDPGGVFDGRNAQPGEAPYMVSIQLSYRESGHFCGGCLITASYILTAAHCFKYMNRHVLKHLIVVIHDLDSTYRSGSKNRQIGKSNGVYLHSKYNGSEYDIAILKLRKPFRLDSLTKTVQIANHSFPNGQPCLVIGWGRRVNNDHHSTILQIATVRIDRELTCIERNPKTEICAGNLEGGADICVGDSGGPLICENQLVGIVSRGIQPCAQPLIGTVFTNVTAYRGWIDTSLKMLEEISSRNLRNVNSFVYIFY
ncbi:unnamed protein product [Hermetia illucens]|uniref:Peptidase S1 domain-containing protein n=1 Tax=Hermetia illucens TaxID=343691 RepID=A0A7R8YTB9_HERIL|nr:unnamed protein product [Hermetia illucens]